MSLLLQRNSPAAASRLFVPPIVPGPSQQQRIGRNQVFKHYDYTGENLNKYLHNDYICKNHNL